MSRILPSAGHRPARQVRHPELAQPSPDLWCQRGRSKRIQDRERLEERGWILTVGKRGGLVVGTTQLCPAFGRSLPVATGLQGEGMVHSASAAAPMV